MAAALTLLLLVSLVSCYEDFPREKWVCGGSDAEEEAARDTILKECPLFADQINGCCVNHDHCYRHTTQSQTQCDDEFGECHKRVLQDERAKPCEESLDLAFILVTMLGGFYRKNIRDEPAEIDLPHLCRIDTAYGVYFDYLYTACNTTKQPISACCDQLDACPISPLGRNRTDCSESAISCLRRVREFEPADFNAGKCDRALNRSITYLTADYIKEGDSVAAAESDATGLCRSDEEYSMVFEYLYTTCPAIKDEISNCCDSLQRCSSLNGTKVVQAKDCSQQLLKCIQSAKNGTVGSKCELAIERTGKFLTIDVKEEKTGAVVTVAPHSFNESLCLLDTTYGVYFEHLYASCSTVQDMLSTCCEMMQKCPKSPLGNIGCSKQVMRCIQNAAAVAARQAKVSYDSISAGHLQCKAAMKQANKYLALNYLTAERGSEHVRVRIYQDDVYFMNWSSQPVPACYQLAAMILVAAMQFH